MGSDPSLERMALVYQPPPPPDLTATKTSCTMHENKNAHNRKNGVPVPHQTPHTLVWNESRQRKNMYYFASQYLAKPDICLVDISVFLLQET